MYTLEKLSVEEGHYSPVGQGHRQSADTVRIFLAAKGEDPGHKPKDIKDIHKIKVGWQVLMTKGLTGWLQTSPVQEILESGDDFIRFKTMTSVYELRNTDEVLT